MEEKVSEALELRPYPGVDIVPESGWGGWWWLVLVALGGLFLLWRIMRKKPVSIKTAEDRLDELLRQPIDVTADPTEQYGKLQEAFRAYLAWTHHPRWRVISGSEASQRLAEIWPDDPAWGPASLLAEHWKRGEFVQYGQGKATGADLEAYRELIKGIVFHARARFQERQTKNLAIAVKQK